MADARQTDHVQPFAAPSGYGTGRPLTFRVLANGRVYTKYIRLCHMHRYFEVGSKWASQRFQHWCMDASTTAKAAMKPEDLARLHNTSDWLGDGQGQKNLHMRQEIWNGEENRELRIQRPCSCGCDFRDGVKGVGYITGSDANGNGFTVWIESEDVFKAIERVLSPNAEAELRDQQNNESKGN